MKTLGKENMGIVGFSYEVTDIRSKKPLIIKREFGKRTSQKIVLAHGYNWSDEHWWGYGYSYAHVTENDSFYSIVGGYTDYTNENSKSPWVETSVFGEKRGKEAIWGSSYGWSEKYDHGYNYFSLYTDQALQLDNKNSKINEIEREREAAKRKTEDELKNTQTELERMRKQNEFLLKQLEEQQTQIQQNFPPNPGSK